MAPERPARRVREGGRRLPVLRGRATVQARAGPLSVTLLRHATLGVELAGLRLRWPLDQAGVAAHVPSDGGRLRL
jgi:hypothetical protein